MSDKDHHQEKRKQEILDQIVEKLLPQIPLPLRQSAQTFVELYYANVSLEDLTETSIDSLVSSVYGMWDFSLERTPGQTKIRTFVEKRVIQENSISETVVEIVNDNMPFLVDSVTGAINSLGYSIHLVIHPVMQVERDRNHGLKEVLKRTAEVQDKHY